MYPYVYIQMYLYLVAAQVGQSAHSGVHGDMTNFIYKRMSIYIYIYTYLYIYMYVYVVIAR